MDDVVDEINDLPSYLQLDPVTSLSYDPAPLRFRVDRLKVPRLMGKPNSLPETVERDLLSKDVSPPLGAKSLPRLSPVENVVSTLDSPIREEEYLGYLRYLLDGQNKYEIFTRIFPQNTCSRVKILMNSKFEIVVSPLEKVLRNSILHKELAKMSFVINFVYVENTNILWMDVNSRTIVRYDPNNSAGDNIQTKIDESLRTFFNRFCPMYNYLGNILSPNECIKSVDSYKNSHNCQDYALLYAVQRIHGLSHDQAARLLSQKGDSLKKDVTDLLTALSYKVRDEVGKPVPVQFKQWTGK